MSLCPFPKCTNELTGKHAVLCADHHLAMVEGEGRFLVRMKIKACRQPNEEYREHLEDQLVGYTNAAINRAIEANPNLQNQETNRV
ncbi:MAG: hypothetical protein QM488_18385 [Rhizobiaceae bacterium]